MNYEQALVHVRTGSRVRRHAWPLNGSNRWHIWLVKGAGFENSEFWRSGIVNGWGGSVGAADDEDKPCDLTPFSDEWLIQNDGMLYTSTLADRAAKDWVRF